MDKKRFPSIIIGLLFLPFGILLAWIAYSGIIGTLINCLIAFGFGMLLTWVINTLYKSSARKLGIASEHVEIQLIKSSLYLIPFIILALISRALLGWNTMMPFIATGMMSYIASTTMEMNKLGIKGIKISLIPTLLGSGLTMAWTLLYSILF